MTTKHAPATPLPWSGATVRAPKSIWGNVAVGRCPIILGKVKDASDAKFAAHAANAYGPLVEALKVLVYFAGECPQDEGDAYAEVTFDDVHKAANLLRSLGEL